MGALVWKVKLRGSRQDFLKSVSPLGSYIFAMIYPFNTIIILFNAMVWLYTWNASIDIKPLSMSYNRVIKRKEYWRCFTSIFMHGSILHILMNSSSLWNIGNVIEASRGGIYYLETTFGIMVISTLVNLAICHNMCIIFGPSLSLLKTMAVGYSGVIFGWMGILAITQDRVRFGIPFLPIPINWSGVFSPVITLIITQLIVPNASFIGHLSGLLAGLLIGSGALEWLTTPYWVITSFMFVVYLIYFSIMSKVDVRYLQLQTPATSGSSSDGNTSMHENVDIESGRASVEMVEHHDNFPSSVGADAVHVTNNSFGILSSATFDDEYTNRIEAERTYEYPDIIIGDRLSSEFLVLEEEMRNEL